MPVPSMVAIARSQLGQSWQKYCRWWGFSYRVDWCAIFMSWCADQAGLLEAGLFPRYSVVGVGAQWFIDHNQWQYAPEWGGSYTPQAGDIVFFTWSVNSRIGGLDHTGIVEYVDTVNGIVHTIEGNNKGGVGIDLVRRDEYNLSDPVHKYMVGFGVMNATILNITDYTIAAICGNFWRESTVNPGIWETLIPSTWDHVYNYDGIGGYGLGGFTNIEGATVQRLLAYHDWCVANGYSEDDGNAQLYYIIFVERCWKAIYKNDDFDDWLQNTSTDLYQLTDDWCRWWEGNPNDHMPERYSYAQQALAYIQAHKNDDPNNYTWVTGNFYCDTQQVLNNIMCLYFWFINFYSGGSGGGGSNPNRKLLLWMLLRSPALY